MSNQYPDWFINAYSDSIRHFQQQEHSVLRRTVQSDSVKALKKYYPNLTQVDPVELIGRHQPTKRQDTPHGVRELTMNDFSRADFIDDEDTIRGLANPQNEYAKAFAMGFNRKQDQVIIDAADASVPTGYNGGGTAATFSSATTIASGSTGLTSAKMAQTRRVLRQNEAAIGQLHFILTALETEDLMTETVGQDLGSTSAAGFAYAPAANADFGNGSASMHGFVGKWQGFDITECELLDLNGTVTDCYAWDSTALTLGIGQEMMVKIEKLPEYNYSTQVFAKATYGAVRRNELGIVKILCDSA